MRGLRCTGHGIRWCHGKGSVLRANLCHGSARSCTSLSGLLVLGLFGCMLLGGALPCTETNLGTPVSGERCSAKRSGRPRMAETLVRTEMSEQKNNGICRWQRTKV